MMTHLIASILDPGLKTAWIKDNIEGHEAILTRILKWLKSAYSPLVSLLALSQPESSQGTSLEDTLFVDYKKYGAMRDDDSDIDRYFNSKPVQRRIGQDHSEWMLEWWNNNQNEYPCMAKIARDYLAIPSSEVDVKRGSSILEEISLVFADSVLKETLSGC